MGNRKNKSGLDQYTNRSIVGYTVQNKEARSTAAELAAKKRAQEETPVAVSKKQNIDVQVFDLLEQRAPFQKHLRPGTGEVERIAFPSAQFCLKAPGEIQTFEEAREAIRNGLSKEEFLMQEIKQDVKERSENVGVMFSELEQ